MTKSIFGWSYPPGAASDPYAPYNQEETFDNSLLKEAFGDYDGLMPLYRAVYKYTPCGPSVGALITYCKEPDPYMDESGPAGAGYGEEVHEWFWCDDLAQWGSWDDMDKNGAYVSMLGVGSIVEGVDQETETHEIGCDPFEFSAEDISSAFWKAIEAVNEEAESIWNSTHGCETCLKHWTELGVKYDEWSNQMDCGSTPVWEDCPECNGTGTVI